MTILEEHRREQLYAALCEYHRASAEIRHQLEDIHRYYAEPFDEKIQKGYDTRLSMLETIFKSILGKYCNDL